MLRGAAALEDSWYFLTKLNVFLPGDPAVVCLDINPQGLKTHILTKTQHMDVCSRHFGSMEATKMSFLEWMDEQTVMCPDSGPLLSVKKEWAIKSWEGTEKF